MSNKNDLSSRFSKACEDAFLLGINQKKKPAIKQLDFFEQSNWIRGMYKKTIWTSYKCGLWSRNNPPCACVDKKDGE